MFQVNKDDPGSNAFDLFLKTAIITQKYADSTLYRKAGISFIKYYVLKILSEAEEPVTPSGIAKETLKERHDIIAIVNRLKRDNLVDIVPNETDQRSVIIGLTEKGRETLDRAEPVTEEIVNRIMSRMTSTNVTSLTKSLNTLHDNALVQLKQASGKTSISRMITVDSLKRRQ